MNNNTSRNRLCKHVVDMGESSKARRSRTLPARKVTTDDPGRPFKKARYVWQLKGKYHLKSSSSSSNTQDLYSETHSLQGHSSSDTDSDIESDSPEKVSDTFIDTMLMEPSSILSIQSDKPTVNEIPLTLVVPKKHLHEEFLEHWQASQMAKGYVDNTINSLLELWKIAPLDSEVMEDLENDDQVEDEGILMAIQSHGLQTGVQLTNHHEFKDSEASSSNSNFYNKSSYKTVDNVPDLSDAVDNDDQFLSAAVSAAIKKKGLSCYNFG